MLTFGPHNFPAIMNNSILELDFGKLSFLDNILVAELNEGIVFDVENNRRLLQIGNHTFKDQPYGYISLRTNSYSVNPMVYRESAAEPNLKAIAVVTKDVLCRQSAVIEQKFYKDKNSFGIFDNLEEAVNWLRFQLLSVK